MRPNAVVLAGGALSLGAFSFAEPEVAALNVPWRSAMSGAATPIKLLVLGPFAPQCRRVKG